MNEEYIYDIGKYTIGVDKNGEDGIGLTVAIINDNGEIHLLGNCYGDNARCIDLLIKENQQLKKQLQQKEDIINKAIKFVKDYKTEWTSNDEVLNDMDKLLEILDNKGVRSNENRRLF